MVERRTRRSEDPLVALHYKLSATRRDHGLEAIVVADADGLVIAGAGAWPLCEEVAAYAPLLGESESGDSSELPQRLHGRVRVQRANDLWVCLVGDAAAAASDAEDTHGAVSRILAA